VSTNPTSLSERAQISFSNLKSIAAELNQVSDEISQPVKQIDNALKDLNLGIPTWLRIKRLTNEDEEFYEDHDLGYAKVERKWGIALRASSGEFAGGDVESKEWLFADAPRSLRLEGIEKLPELLEQMTSEAQDVIKRARASAKAARDLAAIISGPKPVDLMAALKASVAEQKQKTGGGK
jgi:hypothetical protein